MCGGAVGDVLDATSDVLGTSGGGGGILGAVEDVGQAIGDVGASFEKKVIEPLGGYKVVAPVGLALAAPYLAPALAAEGAGAAAFTGATETGLATLAGESALADTVGAALLSGAAETAAEAIGQALPYTEAFDAVNLAKQGLTPSQIGTTLSTSGVDPAVGQYMGELAAQGLSPEAIAQEVANLQIPSASQYNVQDVMEQARSTNVPVGSPTSVYTGAPSLVSPGQALQLARMGMGLLGGGQRPQPPQLPQMGGAYGTIKPAGAVDYSGIYNLLALQRARNPNSLLG